jgi:hypothetical protein
MVAKPLQESIGTPGPAYRFPPYQARVYRLFTVNPSRIPNACPRAIIRPQQMRATPPNINHIRGLPKLTSLHPEGSICDFLFVNQFIYCPPLTTAPRRKTLVWLRGCFSPHRSEREDDITADGCPSSRPCNHDARRGDPPLNGHRMLPRCPPPLAPVVVAIFAPLAPEFEKDAIGTLNTFDGFGLSSDLLLLRISDPCLLRNRTPPGYGP